MSDTRDQGLSPEELSEHETADLPPREAMALIKPGGGLIEGGLVEPGEMMGGGSTDPAATQPTDTTDTSGVPEYKQPPDM